MKDKINCQILDQVWGQVEIKVRDQVRNQTEQIRWQAYW
jgi:hypothetical protein